MLLLRYDIYGKQLMSLVVHPAKSTKQVKRILTRNKPHVNKSSLRNKVVLEQESAQSNICRLFKVDVQKKPEMANRNKILLGDLLRPLRSTTECVEFSKLAE